MTIRDESGRLWVLACIRTLMLRGDDGTDLCPIAKMHLREQGYEVLWPHYSATRKHARRQYPALRSLYPGLMYIGADEQHGLKPIDSTPGVLGMVRFGVNVAFVPPRVIEAERKLCLNDEGLREAPPWATDQRHPLYVAGQKIRSLHDAWANYVAIVEADDGEVVRVWREIWGRRVPTSYYHREIEPWGPGTIVRGRS